MPAGDLSFAQPAQPLARAPPADASRAQAGCSLWLVEVQKEEIMETTEQSERVNSRPSFLLRGLAVGAGAIGAGRLLASASPALASGGLTPGDAAILRFLAAAEILETDAWQQYNELGGVQDSEVPGGSGSAKYTAALQVLDS